MNNNDLVEMIDMLIKATQNRRLAWDEMNTNTYLTHVDGCGIELSSGFEFEVGDAYYKLSLSNADGELFANYSFSEITDASQYQSLKNLEVTIRDVRYRITESENAIMNGLRKMTKDK